MHLLTDLLYIWLILMINVGQIYIPYMVPTNMFVACCTFSRIFVSPISGRTFVNLEIKKWQRLFGPSR